MEKIIFDFDKIDSEDKLYQFLDSELDLDSRIEGGWGKNLYAFWDTYGYSNDEHLFELKHYHSIEDGDFKRYVGHFIEVLDRLKGFEEDGNHVVPNPNFDYKIVD